MFDYAVIEEEYQACASRREEKESTLNDARAELEALIADVEQHTQRLSRLETEEEEAKNITLSHPQLVNSLTERIECVVSLFGTDKPIHASPPAAEQPPNSTNSNELIPGSANTDEPPPSSTCSNEHPHPSASTDEHPLEEVENMDTTPH